MKLGIEIEATNQRIKNHTMKSLSLVVFGLTTLLFAGCSSTPTKVDHGPIKATSFSFVSTAGRAQPAYAEQRADVHKMIQDAITANLAGRGVTRVQTGGEITVAYLIIVGNNATTTSINDYFGYGRDVGALDEIAHEKYTQDNKNPNYFEAGTILIDIIDTRTGKLLRRNYASRPLLANPTAEMRAAQIQAGVNEALQGLRIAN
jgi:hypothetical protein